MHLYLCDGAFTTEVQDIGVRDGCYPCIGERTLFIPCGDSDADALNEFLEPAIWFKVLLLDSVTVDCKHRAILWNTKQSDPLSDTDVSEVDSDIRDSLLRPERRQYRNRVAESMYIGGDCYGDHSDLDEVFDITGEVLKKYIDEQISEAQLHDSVFMLLHCYVLPFIYISRDDTQRAKRAAMVLDGAIDDVHGEILDKNAKVEGILQAMRKQQDKFVEEFMTEGNVSYSTDFLECLTQGVSEATEKILYEMDLVQGHVEELKQKVGAVSTTEGAVGGEEKTEVELQLKNKRDERNKLLRKLQDLMMVREELKQHLQTMAEQSSRRSRKKSKIKHDPLHQMYLGMNYEVEEIIKEVQALMSKKVLILSLKEALRITRMEITKGEHSYGVHYQNGGQRKATDVLHHSNIPPQWLSLSELVARIVQDDNSEIGAMHNRFCKDITNRCNAAVFERALLDAAANVTESNSENSTQSSIEHSTSVHNDMFDNKPSDPIPVMFGQVLDDAFARPVSSSSLGSVCLFEASSEDLISRNSLSFENLRLTMDTSTKQKNSGCTPFSRFRLRSCSDSTTPYGSPRSIENDSGSSIQKSFQIGDSSEIEQKEMEKMVDIDDTDDDLVIIYDTEKNYMRKSINFIKDEILTHFQTIVLCLQTSLQKEGDSYSRKIWQVYENQFYARIMEPLLQLYQVEYAHISTNLSGMVPLLCMSDLKLESSSISSLLEGARRSTCPSKPVIFKDVTPSGTPEKSVNPNSKALQLSPISEADENDSSSPRKSENKRRHTSGLGKLLNKMSSRVEKGLESLPSKIYVYHPTSSTPVDDHCALPKPQSDVLAEANAEACLEATSLDSSHSIPIPDTVEPAEPVESISPSSLRLQPVYFEKFKPIFACIDGSLSETSPLQKLQLLTKCLREIEISFFSSDSWGHNSPPSSDDLVDMLVVLLCNCEPSCIGQLYVQVVLLSDIIAPFYTAGPFNFTLVQFLVAFQFLQEQLVLKRRETEI